MKKLKYVLLMVVPGLLLFGLTELCLRLVQFDYEYRVPTFTLNTVAGFNGTMEEYKQTTPDPPGYFWVREDHIRSGAQSNSRSYRWPFAKPYHIKRIAFLGGSTTEDIDNCYPRRVIDILNHLEGREVYEMLNVGLSGYTTHQSLKALQRFVLPRDPDLVVIYHGWNDPGISKDGMADKEKDRYWPDLKSLQPPAPWRKKVSELRILKALGKIKDSQDKNWQRPRVDGETFRENLITMVELCAEKRVPVLLIGKPKSHVLSDADRFLQQPYLDYYGPQYGTEHVQITDAMHTIYSSIQKEISDQYSGVTWVDAKSYLDDAQNRIPKETERVAIFLTDAMHNTTLGKQKLAELVAMHVRPEKVVETQSYIASGDYLATCSETFIKQGAVFEAAYLARLAQLADPGHRAKYQSLIDQAEKEKPFWRAFQDGRWRGYMKPDDNLDQQLALLQQCLQQRPADFGVCLQIFRVCTYHQKPGRAIHEMKSYQPTSLQGQVNGLSLYCQAFAAAERWEEAELAVKRLVELDPQNPEAAQMYRILKQQREQ